MTAALRMAAAIGFVSLESGLGLLSVPLALIAAGLLLIAGSIAFAYLRGIS